MSIPDGSANDSPYLETDYRRTVEGALSCRSLPGTGIEIIHELEPGRDFRHVLFDFDGTLSLVREGWPEVMVPMMVDEILATGTLESKEEIYRLCHDFVMKLNGKQTIYQMIRLAEEISRRGGRPLDPAAYKEKYHERLMEKIRARRESLRTRSRQPEEFLVPGALKMLSSLQSMGIPMYLASGTDTRYVLEEADLLGLVPYFGDRIYGAVEDFRGFSKKKVIERILREHQVAGKALLGFGDGYVEIENIKSVGGIAVAVASDEAGRSGKPDVWKRDRLIGVGADVVIADFSESKELLGYLFSQKSG